MKKNPFVVLALIPLMALSIVSCDDPNISTSQNSSTSHTSTSVADSTPTNTTEAPTSAPTTETPTTETPSTPTSAPITDAPTTAPSTPEEPSSSSSTIEIIQVTSVTISGPSRVEKGASINLTTTVLPENASYTDVAWESKNDGVATVDNQGVVTGVTTGEVNIVAICGGVVSSAYKVTVYEPVVEATSVTISGDNEVLLNETITLTATVLPETTTDKTLSWRSTNEAVATVSNGVVTGVSTGTCKIIAQCGSVSSESYTVTVKDNIDYGSEEAPISISSLNTIVGEYEVGDWTPKDCWFTGIVNDVPTSKAISGGTVYDFHVKDEITDDIIYAYHVYYYTDISVVEKGDKVVINSPITKEQTRGLSTSPKYNVNPKTMKVSRKLESFTLSVDGDADARIKLNETLNLKATSNQKNAKLGTLTYTSSNTDVASVSNEGVVTGLTSGTVTITAEAQNGVKATIDVEVYENIDVLSVTVTGDNTVSVGRKIKLTATKNPTNAAANEITWKSSDTTKATVSTTGEVVGKAIGTTNITATIGGVTSDEFEVTVTELNLGSEGNELSTSEAIEIIDNVDSSAYSTKYAYVTGKVTEVTTKSNAINKITISDGINEFLLFHNSRMPFAEGITTVEVDDVVCAKGSLTLYNNSKYELVTKSDVTLQVYKAVGKLNSITLSSTKSEIQVDETIDISVAKVSANADISTGVWSSSNEAVATVSNGTVTGLTEGTTTIKLTIGEGETAVDDSFVLTVKAKVVATGVTISAADSATSVAVGGTLQCGATVIPEGAIDKEVTWHSSDDSKATIDETTGKITGVAEGSVDITATIGSITSNKLSITITAKPDVGNSYTYNLVKGSGLFVENNSVTDYKCGDYEWSTSNNGNFIVWDANNNKGFQIGSGSDPAKEISLSTKYYSGGIKKLSMNCSGAKSINGKITAYINGEQIGEKKTLTTTPTDYVFEVANDGVLSGEVKFVITQTSSKAIYIKSFGIN